MVRGTELPVSRPAERYSQSGHNPCLFIVRYVVQPIDEVPRSDLSHMIVLTTSIGSAARAHKLLPAADSEACRCDQVHTLAFHASNISETKRRIGTDGCRVRAFLSANADAPIVAAQDVSSDTRSALVASKDRE